MPSASKGRAVLEVERIISEARRDGYLMAMNLVEREVYSCSDLGEFLAWLRGERVGT